MIVSLFLVGAVVAGWFLGWRAGVEVAVAYMLCLVGANSPQTFMHSKKGLERIAASALTKARELTQSGK